MSSILGFDIPKLHYTTGENLRGAVIFQPKVDKKVNGVFLYFTGYEFCENGPLSDIPFQKKWILDGSTSLYGNAVPKKGEKRLVSERDGVEIKAGKYTWPFSFKIPKNIPPSADYRHGRVKIEYTLLVVVDVPWAKGIRATQTLRIGFPYVIDPERPKNVVNGKKSFLFHSDSKVNFSKPHHLTMSAWLDSPITFSGDLDQLHLKLDNNSGRHVHSIKVKLKQQWSYGTTYHEKFTIFKVKHKDRNFPLGSRAYTTKIPIVVPNCDLRPTITNASLMRCTYFISIRATVRAGGDLKLRIPLIMASFKPMLKSEVAETLKKAQSPVLSTQKEAQIQTAKEAPKEPLKEEIEENPPEVSLLDWDATDEKQAVSFSTLQPQPASPETALFKPSQEFKPEDFKIDGTKHVETPANLQKTVSNLAMEEIQYGKVVEDMKHVIHDLNTTAQWASTGHIFDAVEIEPGMSQEKARSELSKAVDRVRKSTEELVEAALKKNTEEALHSAKQLSARISEMKDAAQVCAALQGEATAQQAILSAAKAGAISSLQITEATRDTVYHDPFSSVYSSDYMQNQLKAAEESVVNNLKNLVKTGQDAMEASLKRQKEIELAKKSLQDLMVHLSKERDTNNPFLASLEDVNNSAINFATEAHQFVEHCHGSHQEIVNGVKKLVSSTQTFLENSMSAALKYPDHSKKLRDNAETVARATQKLLDVAQKALKQGNLQHPLNLENELSSTAKILQDKAHELIALSPPQPKAKEPNWEEVEQKAEVEMAGAVEAITKANKMLRDASASSHKVELDFSFDNPFLAVDHKAELVDASSSVAQALEKLLGAAHEAQKQRFLQNKLQGRNAVYHRDPTWTQGLVSASQKVVSLVQQLCDVVLKKEWEEEVVVALIKKISSATAQLVAAESAKSSPESQTHINLKNAARLVAASTAELTQKIHEFAHHAEVEPPIQSPKPKREETFTGTRVKELEAAVKISKLEKELNKAREEMHGIYKESYQKSKQKQ